MVGRIADFPEHVGAQCVEADGDPSEAGAVELGSFFLEEDTVGGECEVGLWMVFCEGLH